MSYARITATGAYLPEKILTNHDLAALVDTSHEWIVERSGICERRIAASGETVVSMGAIAAGMALKNAGLVAHDIDLILVATCSAEHAFPSAACGIQAILGATKAAAFDISAACAGFVYALSTAAQFIQSGGVKNVLVIGSEVLSRVVDWTDRTSCVLFGDGAGAVVLSAAEKPGVLAYDLHADGKLGSILSLKQFQQDAAICMQGREVFKHAVTQLVRSSEKLMKKAGLDADAIDWVVPHQANSRIIDMVVSRLGLNPERVVVTLDKHANTSAASIPLALHEAVSDGRIQPGQTLLLEAFGGGLVWGGLILQL
ncbi:MAG: 3-oxoacyl-ACP synthase [Gammaproteobacteria bacterium CG11_big_fil_rev_8_21_14_0_20_46_22]|nr:MAG: 3-oxoacyl-ACP synthase [Gammaproteobacteria bacterium CG12_big_fil_rev_8_21_14_0_65_46_12]PIR12027.1 MAG: 3-oxoacyl-ACP synthase [Gammaproteobacteria bacterium CG11_big_fil_rev_8_21_14_0_20_46_22]